VVVRSSRRSFGKFSPLDDVRDAANMVSLSPLVRSKQFTDKMDMPIMLSFVVLVIGIIK
jgi:hypothetical protein